MGQPAARTAKRRTARRSAKRTCEITKKNYDWPSTSRSSCRTTALAHWRKTKERGAKQHAEWNAQMERPIVERIRTTRRSSSAASRASCEPNWAAKIPTFTKENGNVATRAAFGAVLNATADAVPELVGGSADLTPSNNTSVKAWKDFTPEDYAGRYIHFGIREHGMARDHERHGHARGHHSVRRDVPDLLGLHASVGASRVLHAPAGASTSTPTIRSAWARTGRRTSRSSSSRRCARFRTSR